MEESGTGGKITLGNRMGKHELDSSVSGQRQMEGSHDLSNELPVPQNAGNFLTI
jgi:hypothetical protein